MLDMSAAFDLLPHDMLLKRLKQELGLSGVALNWFASYLKERKQTIRINNVTSKVCSLDTGVPRGSILGPLLFRLCICYH
jgi:methylaspartate ammonia-lyase